MLLCSVLKSVMWLLTDSDTTLTITGTGNVNDKSIQNKQIQYKLTFATGVTANVPTQTSPEFGGTKPS
jgi:hypothetical protein